MVMQQQSELPEGWIKTNFSDCVDILDNCRIPVNSKEREKRTGNIPYYGATGRVGWIDDFLFDEELLLLGEDGAPFFDKTKSIAYIIQGKSWVNNHAHVLRAIENITSNIFLKNYLDYFDFNGFVTGTTRYKLNQSSMKNIPVHLPSLAEQHRIVSAIESLFARLDAANERLDLVPDIVKKFRQSVLAAACDGRLTDGWREENQNIEYPEDFFNQISEKHHNKYIAACEAAKRKGERAPKKPKNIEPTFLENKDFIDVPEKWIWMLLPDIGYMNRGTSRNRPRNDPFLFGGKYPFIQTGEIARSNGRITTHKKTYNENGLAQSKLWPKGTVCITIAANIANSGILTYPACFPDSVVGVIPDDEICNHEYLEYFIRTAKDNLSQFAPATAQKNINIAILNDVAIPLPPLPEQHEIVRRVDALFALADSIEAKVAAAQERTEKLRQSILAKAFSGELVETEAELARREGRDYEPADVLLERIKSEQGMSGKKGKAAKGKSTHRRE